ncbi:MAG: hypothetical protein EAZ91_21710 [Cytophagales bacterium]|nr:MAG: hypothetical protein EAZ91_21710 [Cytophagales bacterium]
MMPPDSPLVSPLISYIIPFSMIPFFLLRPRAVWLVGFNSQPHMRGLIGFWFGLLLLGSIPNTSAQNILTVAGTGTPGFSGDNGPAISAKLFGPYGVAIDASGNIFFVDVDDNYVRKITPGGIISTVAGNGTQGFSGDNGPATSAQLNKPIAVAVDASGNLYIADFANQRIRKVTPGGIISTIAGTGVAGDGGDNGFAINAQLNGPVGLVVDAIGFIYFADSGNHRVRCITNSGVMIAVAGTGVSGYSGDGGDPLSAKLSHPSGLAFNASGNLYITDLINNCVRKITQSQGPPIPQGPGLPNLPGPIILTISTVVGTGIAGFSGDGGAATSAQLSSPTGVAIDASGSIYIADRDNNRIRKVTSGGTISTIAGTGTSGFSGDGGPATSAQLNTPVGVVVDPNGNIIFADKNNYRIRKIRKDLLLTTSASAGPACTPTVSVSATGGRPPYSYAWTAPAGVVLTGGSTASVVASAGASGVQTLNVTVTDSDLSPQTSTSMVSVNLLAQPTVTLVFNNSATVMGAGVPTITVPNTPGQEFSVLGADTYVRSMVQARVNGYQISVDDSPVMSRFPITQMGSFTIKASLNGGCSRTVQGVLASQ